MTRDRLGGRARHIKTGRRENQDDNPKTSKSSSHQLAISSPTKPMELRQKASNRHCECGGSTANDMHRPETGGPDNLAAGNRAQH